MPETFPTLCLLTGQRDDLRWRGLRRGPDDSRGVGSHDHAASLVLRTSTMLASRLFGLPARGVRRRVSVAALPKECRREHDREARGRNRQREWAARHRPACSGCIRSNDPCSTDPVGSLMLSMLTRNCVPRRPGPRPAVFMLSPARFEACGGRASAQVGGGERCNGRCHGPQDQQNWRKLPFSTVGKPQVVVDLTWSQLLCSFSRSQDRCCERCAFGAFPEGVSVLAGVLLRGKIRKYNGRNRPGGL